MVHIAVHCAYNDSWDGIMGDVECQKALVAKLLGYLLILGSLTVKAPQVRISPPSLARKCRKEIQHSQLTLWRISVRIVGSQQGGLARLVA